MFTGIIEEVGIVKKKNRNTLDIEASFSNELNKGDSVSVNGVCLTVVKTNKDKSFEVEIMEETENKSNLNNLKIGNEVNLERAMKSSGRFDGHFVSGHVDSIGKVNKLQKRKSSWVLEIEYENKFNKFLVEKGSVSVNGVSLTVVKENKNTFSVSLVGFTLKNTTFKKIRVGDKVNLEFDLVSKYLYKWNKV